MDINIASIKNYEGKKIDIDCDIPLCGMRGDDFKILAPVKVVGDMRNFGGTIELEATGKVMLEFFCDRCADEFEQELSFPISERFKEPEKFTDDDNEYHNPDINYLSSDEINLDEYVYSSLVLSVPGKHLCSEDCLGLCPVCGVNLNNETCSCEQGNTDPRFDVLDGLEL